MVDQAFCCSLAAFIILLEVLSASAYYCDNDKCDFDEYCCGHNICCTSYNVWQMWYFWLGLVLFLILLAGCFSFWRYRFQQAVVVQACSHADHGYKPLTNVMTSPLSRSSSIPSSTSRYSQSFLPVDHMKGSSSNYSAYNTTDGTAGTLSSLGIGGTSTPPHHHPVVYT